MSKSGKLKQIHQTRKIEKISTHPDYSKGKLENNLALVKLDKPVRICPGHVETVKLPSCNEMKPKRQSSGRAASPSKSQNAWPPQVKVSIKSKKGNRFIEVKPQVNRKEEGHKRRGAKERQSSKRKKSKKKAKGAKKKRSRGNNQKKSGKGKRKGRYYPGNVFSRDSFSYPMAPRFQMPLLRRMPSMLSGVRYTNINILQNFLINIDSFKNILVIFK